MLVSEGRSTTARPEQTLRSLCGEVGHRGSCRFCAGELSVTFADLGMTPLSNSFVDDLSTSERFFPLHALVCPECKLVQLEKFESPEAIFGEYSYFSSYSDSWLQHAERYVEQVIERFGFDCDSQVVEVASNDGYLLQYFQQRGIPVLGIDPAANVAREAVKKGIPTEVEFFGVETARRLAAEGRQADLLIGNNVLAHVPDLNDFVAGLQIALKPRGLLTLEFPHLLRMIAGCQFDTIYHEHFSYFSLGTLQQIFSAHGLTVFDVEELPTHGGSIRIYVCHHGSPVEVGERVEALRQTEIAAGLDDLRTYESFTKQIQRTKRRLLAFLIEAKDRGARIAGYGAPAKGNSLLNYCGIRTDFLDFTVDRSPHKQGRYLPGTRIPIREPAAIFEHRPDFVLILPWNLRDEISAQMSGIREWGGKFVVPIPEVEVLP